MFLLLCSMLYADTQLWMKGAYRTKIASKVHIKFTQHLRFEDNVTAVDSIIPELELYWKGLRGIDTLVGYRYFWRRTKNDVLERAHRVHVDLEKDWSWRPKLGISYRARLQARQEFDEDEAKIKLRHRIGLNYKYSKRYKPHASVEYQISSDGHDCFQWIVGVRYKINRSSRVGLKLMFEQFIHTTPFNIVPMLNYEYRRKKKE